MRAQSYQVMAESSSIRTITRRGVIGAMAAGTLGCIAETFWWEPNRLKVNRHDIRCPKLPPSLDGLRVGVMSDFHFRPGSDDELVGKAVEEANAENLDLIFLPGDFVTDSPSVITPLLGHLNKLRARHGIFASLGNHDGWSNLGSRRLRNFEKAGISMLINQNSLLDIDGEIIAIAATDFVWLGKPDPLKTLRGIPTDVPVLALVHEPDYFDTLIKERRIDLQVSGHTHGGQCRIPFIPYTPVKVLWGEKYIRGSFENDECRLFVTSGVGTVGAKIRFACTPELAVLTLKSATS